MPLYPGRQLPIRAGSFHSQHTFLLRHYLGKQFSYGHLSYPLTIKQIYSIHLYGAYPVFSYVISGSLWNISVSSTLPAQPKTIRENIRRKNGSTIGQKKKTISSSPGTPTVLPFRKKTLITTTAEAVSTPAVLPVLKLSASASA